MKTAATGTPEGAERSTDDAALARLKRLEADPTMRHTGARWRAHEAVYPGSGAAELAGSYAARDADLEGQLEASLQDFRRKLPEDEEVVAYFEWMLGELRDERLTEATSADAPAPAVTSRANRWQVKPEAAA